MTSSRIHPKIQERAARNLGKRRKRIASDQRICTGSLVTALVLLKELDGLPEAERGEVNALIAIYTWALGEIREIDPNEVRDTGRLTAVCAVLQSCTARLLSLKDRVAPRAKRSIATSFFRRRYLRLTGSRFRHRTVVWDGNGTRKGQLARRRCHSGERYALADEDRQRRLRRVVRVPRL